LLKNKDQVIGALGFDTLNDKVVEFRVKAVFVGTGGCGRMYPSSTPGWIFNIPFCPVLTGDGRAIVYRAGGELSDMESAGVWAGAKYFARAGKATWIGVLTGPDDRPIGPFISKPDRIYGDITSDAWPTVFNDYMISGKGPVYNDCRGASDEDLDYMRHWLLHEGNKGLLDHMAEEGIDLREHAVEFRTYGQRVRGGVWFDVNGKTSLKGLYSAGDEYLYFSGGMDNAAIWGWVAGEQAAKDAKGEDRGDLSKVRGQIDEKVAMLDAILCREDGPTWKEANIALQQIMFEYAGLVRSETVLEQGLRNLRRLKEKVHKTLIARNGHELGRCLEVLNLVDVGETVMLAAKERKETRGKHNRVDYPFTNPLFDKHLVIKKEDGKPVLQWREREK
jgi:succinate dehydrogenase/fumarate reductase flavoprotein subunit